MQTESSILKENNSKIKCLNQNVFDSSSNNDMKVWTQMLLEVTMKHRHFQK